ncbi:Electron transport complex subunit RsxD [Caprobacter fermentans]|uniref:Ion-translocating oxidoreductase complex subunit D n=1 Tax=Caproicibacter fermentans TaxID=2576756 RepID=A0A6N8I459_9FIRM|nr:RnfABCDGE type electron transport complex subunit D [Caproicibacter fermentans]MVB12390.1 Electron transport complex subunit RsxD [Caproicibacter fermentans]OCN03045.1 NADH:ubiquinone oxidoreductase [Clostridium sp. W14A]QNK40618.1 RnfABCDGE type electron transport complex subunit D [Caproicibacter fermentans]
MEEKLVVSSSPHIRSGATTRKIMLDVILALVPAAIAAVIVFGPRTLLIIGVTIASCVLSEYICRRVMKRENTIGDLSAVVTGLLLAFNLPVSINPLMAAFGGMVAIVVIKQMFGGIGQNFVNPALTARIIMLNSFPTQMTTWVQPHSYLGDAVTTASPLGLLKEGGSLDQMPSLMSMFVGNTAGCIGETCALALILGGIYLVVRKVISPVIPLCYIGTAAVLSAVMGRNVMIDLLSGGLMLGAIFMATDYATSPITVKGQVIFAIGCGVITMLIRNFGSLPEGVSYSIVLMNIIVPLIDSATRPVAFGKEPVKDEVQR